MNQFAQIVRQLAPEWSQIIPPIRLVSGPEGRRCQKSYQSGQLVLQRIAAILQGQIQIVDIAQKPTQPDAQLVTGYRLWRGACGYLVKQPREVHASVNS